MDPSVQVLDPTIEVRLVVLPSQPIDPGRCISLQSEECCPKHWDTEMVEERGEPLLPSLPCCPSFFALRLVVRVPAPGTRFPGPAPGACFADSRSPRPRPLAPPTPLPVVWRCSSASLLLWPGLTSRVRTSAATAPRLPAADQHRFASLAEHETSRFPSKERLHMPGSPTTPGRPGTRARAPVRVAFRDLKRVGTQGSTSFAAERYSARSADMRLQPGVDGSRRPGRRGVDDAKPTSAGMRDHRLYFSGDRCDACYLARSGSADPLSGSPAFSVRDCAASSRTLARIGSNGPNLCCSGLNWSA